MKESYLKYLENNINYREYLHKLKEEEQKTLLAIEKNQDDCLHDLLITFGELEDARIFGLREKYYCPFCLHIIYKSVKENDFENKEIINLKKYDYNDNKKIILINLQTKLYEYLKSHKEVNLLEIKDYIELLALSEVLIPYKKILKK